MTRTLPKITMLILTAVVMLLPIGEAFAQGSLMVNPKRIVLGEKKRTDNVTLFNSGNDSADYVISLVHYRMMEDGSFKEIPDSVKTDDILFSDSVIRYFPLQVTLGPHESQAVHVRFTKPSTMAPGEYRSHMYFRAIEKAKALEAVAKDTSQHTISLSLHPIFGLSIPIIVRYQTSPDVITMDNGFYSSVDTGGNGTVTANLNRTGNESCYGTFIVYYKDASGTETQVGLLKGVAVYVPLTMRKVSVGFKLPKDTDPTKGTFRMEYQTLTDNPRETVLASCALAYKK
jgi:hypothetical protein